MSKGFFLRDFPYISINPASTTRYQSPVTLEAVRRTMVELTARRRS